MKRSKNNFSMQNFSVLPYKRRKGAHTNLSEVAYFNKMTVQSNSVESYQLFPAVESIPAYSYPYHEETQWYGAITPVDDYYNYSTPQTSHYLTSNHQSEDDKRKDKLKEIISDIMKSTNLDRRLVLYLSYNDGKGAPSCTSVMETSAMKSNMQYHVVPFSKNSHVVALNGMHIHKVPILPLDRNLTKEQLTERCSKHFLERLCKSNVLFECKVEESSGNVANPSSRYEYVYQSSFYDQQLDEDCGANNNSVVQGMMLNMGYKSGEGLGRTGSSSVNYLDIPMKNGTKGLGYDNSGKFRHRVSRILSTFYSQIVGDCEEKNLVFYGFDKFHRHIIRESADKLHHLKTWLHREGPSLSVVISLRKKLYNVTTYGQLLKKLDEGIETDSHKFYEPGSYGLSTFNKYWEPSSILYEKSQEGDMNGIVADIVGDDIQIRNYVDMAQKFQLGNNLRGNEVCAYEYSNGHFSKLTELNNTIDAKAIYINKMSNYNLQDTEMTLIDNTSKQKSESSQNLDTNVNLSPIQSGVIEHLRKIMRSTNLVERLVLFFHPNKYSGDMKYKSILDYSASRFRMKYGVKSFVKRNHVVTLNGIFVFKVPVAESDSRLNPDQVTERISMEFIKDLCQNNILCICKNSQSFEFSEDEMKKDKKVCFSKLISCVEQNLETEDYKIYLPGSYNLATFR